jgi:sulfate adenylyltransferase (ADP) / ATP adenylyltransferase
MTLQHQARPFTLPFLSYAHFAYRLEPNLAVQSAAEQADALINAYLALLDLVVSTARHQPDDRQLPNVGAPSYNVLLTLQHLHLVPRFQEKHRLELTGEDLPINSLGFAGALLVKSDAELHAVKEEGKTV